MKLLVLETSTSRTEVAFLDDDQTLFAENFTAPRRETGPLFSLLEKALCLGGQPDRIVVGTGPGSYNGIRAGIAAAEALALGLQKPLIGVCSLHGYSAPAEEYAVIGDARSQQFYFAHFDKGRLLADPALYSETELHRRLDSLPVIGFAPLAPFPQLQPGFPSAIRLGEVAARVAESDFPQGAPTPLYLKPAHITSCKPASAR